MVKSQHMYYLGDDQGCPGCHPPPFGCFVNVRPTFLDTNAEAHERTSDAKFAHMIGLAVTTVIGGLAELLPSKLASLWMDELTLSFSCFTAGKRQREKKHFGSIKCLINTGSAASWYSVRGCMMLPSCYHHHHLTSSGPRRTRHKTSKWGRNNGRRYANKKSISNTFQERLKRNKSVTDAQETSTKLTGYMRKNK